MYIGVLVELSNKNIDKKFIYSVPPQFEKRIKLGIRVEVPFGHQTLEGFIVSFEPKPDIETKNIDGESATNVNSASGICKKLFAI